MCVVNIFLLHIGCTDSKEFTDDKLTEEMIEIGQVAGTTYETVKSNQLQVVRELLILRDEKDQARKMEVKTRY